MNEPPKRAKGFRRPALFVALSALGLAAVPVLAGAPTSQETDAETLVYRVAVHQTIELGLAPFVERSVAEAADEGADAVVLDVDTPGGRVDAAQRISDAVSDSGVPVYAYVNRRALSAGALISLSADRIFMRPGSNIGAATPVTGEGQPASEKMVSAMRSTMRSLAEARGLDPAVAEAMVDEDIEIEGVVEAGKLLTLTSEEAVELGYAEQVDTLDDLLDAVGLPGARIHDTEVNWAERIVRFLSNPIVASLLLSIGMLALVAEVYTPGLGVAGAIGLFFIALFFGSHLIVGLAGMEGILLFGLGVLLILVEVLLLPGMGIFGALGAVAVLAGLYLSLLGELPAAEDYQRGAAVLSGALLLVVAGSWIMARRLPTNTRLLKAGIFLGSATGRSTGYTSSERREELVGQTGRAVTDLRPAGTGNFDGERIDIVSETGWIESGTPIRIVASEGYRHVVRPVTVEDEEGSERVGSGDGDAEIPGVEL